MKSQALALFFATLLLLSLPAVKAQSASDACTLLNPNQISAAVGSEVGAGTHVTPTFTATCTWTAPGKIVTLMTEGVAPYNAGKTPPSPAMQIVPVSGIGDDAYYVVIGNMVSLLTKKGSTAFKTTVYCSKLPVATLKSMESTLAQQVASEL